MADRNVYAGPMKPIKKGLTVSQILASWDKHFSPEMRPAKPSRTRKEAPPTPSLKAEPAKAKKSAAKKQPAKKAARKGSR